LAETPQLKPGLSIIDLQIPAWWHLHGGKMEFDEKESREGSTVVFRASAAKITIRLINGDKFEVTYWINNGWRGEINGLINMDRKALEAAFGLKDEMEDSSVGTIKKYGATVARQGIFIRWKEFLNIPSPGTGSDGDPNVSVFITDEIKEAIANSLR
jgi:hypothetical protein